MFYYSTIIKNITINGSWGGIITKETSPTSVRDISNFYFPTCLLYIIMINVFEHSSTVSV